MLALPPLVIEEIGAADLMRIGVAVITIADHAIDRPGRRIRDDAPYLPATATHLNLSAKDVIRLWCVKGLHEHAARRWAIRSVSWGLQTSSAGRCKEGICLPQSLSVVQVRSHPINQRRSNIGVSISRGPAH